MKRNLLTLFLIAITITANAQGCLPDGISFHSQIEIDSFSVNFPGCTHIEGSVEILNNSLITNLDGLSVISCIAGHLSIDNCFVLTDLSGLNNLDSIGGSLIIENNDNIQSVDGFNDLQYIGGSIEIYGNTGLTSITAFPNVTFDSINDLSIYENPNLQSCTSSLVCSFLSDPKGMVNIYANSAGCNSPGEIAETCGIPSVCLPYGNQIIINQAEIDNFSEHYSGCTTLHGLTFIVGSSINNLNGLSQVTHIAGDLHIKDANLTNLYGLHNIDSVDRNLTIQSIDVTSLSGLENLEYIGNSLFLNELQDLTSITQLSNIKSLNFLEIALNYNLTSLHGLDSLKKLVSLRLTNNYTLSDISALSNVDSIRLNMDIQGLYALSSIEDLSNLKYVGMRILIYDNHKLTSLKGLENIKGNLIQSVSIIYNDLLTECEVASICEYLADTSAYTDICYNGSGCNSVQQVRAACETVDADNIDVKDNISVYPNPTNGIFMINGDLNGDEELAVYDYCGKKLMMVKLHKGDSVIDISHFPNGLYLAVIKGNRGVSSRKIFKQ